MNAILIILIIYFLTVLVGWAMVLHFTHEGWWAAFVPGWGLYKRVKALEKLDMPINRGILGLFVSLCVSSLRIGRIRLILLVWALLAVGLYLFEVLLMHVTCFWKLAKRAGEDTPFALGMVLCPPLFMNMLWNRHEYDLKRLHEDIRQYEQEEEKWLKGPPVWKCPGCGALWPTTHAVCKECGEDRPADKKSHSA